MANETTIYPAPEGIVMNGKVEVKVTVRESVLRKPLESATVRPTRHGIAPRVEANTLTFTLDIVVNP